MIASLWVCVGLLAQALPVSAPERDAYKQALAQAGRGAEAQVKLALWCESHGLDAERLEHLARAVLLDPKNALAHGMMGWSIIGVAGNRRKRSASGSRPTRH